MYPIRDFILSTIENFYKDSSKLNENCEEILLEFIHNSQVLLLQTCIKSDVLYFYTKIEPNTLKSIIFYKTVADTLTADDAILNINIITLSRSPEESLYQILRQIYSPLLASGDDLYSNKLHKNLSELETNLRVLTHGKDGSNKNVILSISDEVDYWKTVSQSREKNKNEREAASSFCVLFEDISEEVRSLQTGNMQEVKDSAENIGGILDDIWRSTLVPYPEDRMCHIFDIIGHILCSVTQNAVAAVDIWKPYDGLKESQIILLLSESMSAVQIWISACKSLTETYWPNYALHAWKGKPYIPTFCLNFQQRLKEIHDIRSTYNQLNKLLTASEKTELKTNTLFEPFQNINIWICNGPTTTWDNAVSQFTTNLRPAESKIAEKLKPRLHNTSTKQMLYEFTRYKTLISRPLIKHSLGNELEVFVSSLLVMLKDVKSQLESDELDLKMFQPAEMSQLVQQVQWAKQTEAKVKEIQICVENDLQEFDKSSEVTHLALQILKDLKTMYTQWHEDWCRDFLAQAHEGWVSAQARPVVEFSAGLLRVNFDARLLRADLDARALSALGLPPPPPRAASPAALTLTHTLRYARALQQVASFHNTLGERMIPSTQPMMLKAALDLSALVQDHKPVYWNDEEQLAAYTESLKEMVLKLESQNTYLTSQHVAIRNIVEKLMDTELLAKQNEWKKSINDIRGIIEKVESNGYSNTEMWRSHWELQVYKAMECQYIRALLSLHTNFPPMRVELVLRGRSVRACPAAEEVRAQLYGALRRLVALPARLPALRLALDTPTVFATIVDKHSWIGNKAVHQIERTLSSLSALCDTWSVRAALACVPDLEAMCRQHLAAAPDWELNFKACKAYGQAVAKMTFDDEKIDWISVGTISLRREFEAQSRNLWTCLMSSLQTSCRDDTSTLDAFIANVTLLLENKSLPKNSKELSDISAKQQALKEKMPEMEKLVEDLKRKGHLLRTWGGDSSVDATIKEWQKIREQMDAHQQMFKHQAELVKSSLSGEWENISGGVSAWAARWARARPAPADARLPRAHLLLRAADALRALEQLDALRERRDELLTECTKFNLNFKVDDTWTEAESLKNDFIKLWGVLQEYDEDYQSIGGQEWLIFQKKLHLLDEFVARWRARLEPFTIITLYIQQELDKFTDLTVVLKYLRGTDFTERHWCEVYNLVEMEYKKPETLVVNDFLTVADNIKKQMKALQKISSSAASEAAVRSALNELELWYAGARLTLTYYIDKANKQTPIVKDFKDILAKVEEQQWAVWSLGSAGAWEPRLRAAARLLRAAHHVQRRYVPRNVLSTLETLHY